MKCEIESKIAASHSSIEQHNREIEKKIETSQSSIENKISALSATVNSEVNELKCSFSDLKTKLSTDVDALKAHITEHKQRLDNTDDDINRLKLSADLRLNGIPFSQNENLVEIFHKIAASIGYDSTDSTSVPLMKRIPIRNKTTGTMVESSITTLHFTSMQHKQLFYSMYLSKMPLKAETIGLPKEFKIIIGESLTRTNAQIFKFAQNLKKENKIAQVFTADGLVKVKIVKGPNQRTHTIRHNTQLEILLKEHEQQQRQLDPTQTHTHSEQMDVETAHKKQPENDAILDTSIELLSSEHAQNDTQQANGLNLQLPQQHQQQQQQQNQQQQLQLHLQALQQQQQWEQLKQQSMLNATHSSTA